MIVSLALAVVGGAALLVETAGVWIVLVLLGLAGWAITIVRCIQFARHSDLHGVPRYRQRVPLAEPADLSRGDRVAASHSPAVACLGPHSRHVVDAARSRRPST